MSTHATLFLEVLLEELPATMIRPALTDLEARLLQALEGLEYGTVRSYATPRRLAIAIDELQASKPRVESVVTGPPVDRSYDDQGNPTKGAIGFARGKGVDVADLMVVDTPRGKVVAAKVIEGGEEVSELLSAALHDIIVGVSFKKTMEWGRGGVRYARPIHGVVAHFDGVLIPAEVADVHTCLVTQGHRMAETIEVDASTEEAWLSGLRGQGIEPDMSLRQAQIETLLVSAAAQLKVAPIIDEELLEECLQLVESPVLVVGQFDADLLALPERLLVQSMKTHVSVFPTTRDGKLTENFVTISNNPWGESALIGGGYSRVLRARFYDAKFFFKEDKAKSLEEHGLRLGNMRWIRGLGTMQQKASRVSALAGVLAPIFGADVGQAKRAGALCKCDLATAMVGEFDKLQGYMGRLYAIEQGEHDAVATAIEEHYLPKSAADALPQSAVGVTLAVADRLDTLTGCFGIGMIPKGGDPQGLRRAALALINILIAHNIDVALPELFEHAMAHIHSSAAANPDEFGAWTKAQGALSAPSGLAEVVDALSSFTVTRFKARESGLSSDIIDSVILNSAPNPLVLSKKVDALRQISQGSDFLPMMQMFKRVLNISSKADCPKPARSVLVQPAELTLYDAVHAVEENFLRAIDQHDFTEALSALLTLRGPIASFFDELMVESTVPDERTRRVGMMRHISSLFLRVADFTRISTR
jgi:glycyl-tRNA synthetase beta chain